MKKFGMVLTLFLLLCALAGTWKEASAATDGFYSQSEVTPAAWVGTDENRQKATYGDEANVTYTLPWPFKFYGPSYSQITVDTNGNIWFGTTGSANSFDLSVNARGPVIAAWNNDREHYQFLTLSDRSSVPLQKYRWTFSSDSPKVRWETRRKTRWNGMQ